MIFPELALPDLAEETTIECALQTASERYRDKKNWLPLTERLANLDKEAVSRANQLPLPFKATDWSMKTVFYLP